MPSKLQRIQTSVRRPSQTRLSAPTIEAAKPQRRDTSALEAVLDVVEQGVGVITTELRDNIQEDISKQRLRATENQAPSDDATVAGYRAHAVHSMSNKTNRTSNSLKEAALTFNGTEEEWEDLVIQSGKADRESVYSEYSKYNLKNDPAFSKVLANISDESISGIQAVKNASDAKRERDNRILTFKDSLATTAKTTGLTEEVMNDTLSRWMQSNATGLLPSERERAFVDIAGNLARSGDFTLRDFADVYHGYDAKGKELSTSLSERYPELESAEAVGASINYEKNSAKILKEAESIQDRYVNGYISEQDWIAGITRIATEDTRGVLSLSRLVGSGLSAKARIREKARLTAKFNTEQVGAAKDMLKALTTWSSSSRSESDIDKLGKSVDSINKKYETVELSSKWILGQILAGSTARTREQNYNMMSVHMEDALKPDGQSIRTLGLYSDKALSEIGDFYYQKKLESANSRMIEMGIDPSSEKGIQYLEGITIRALDVLGANNIVSKDVQARLVSLSQLGDGNLTNDGKFKTGVNSTLNVFNSMKPEQRREYLNDRELVRAEWLNELRENYNPVQAIKLADKLTDNPLVVSSETRVDIASDAKSFSEDTGSFLISLAPSALKSDKVKLMEGVISSDYTRSTIANMQMGLSYDKATEHAVAAHSKKYTRLNPSDEDILIEGDLRNILSKVFPGKTNVGPKNLGEAFSGVLKKNMSTWESAGYSIDEIYIRTNDEDGTYTVYSLDTNIAIDTPRLLSGVSEGAKFLIEERETAEKERLAEEERTKQELIRASEQSVESRKKISFTGK